MGYYPYYPAIEPFKGYRYTPFKDEKSENYYVDFICIRWISATLYEMMVIKDTLISTDDTLWKYGHLETTDWHVDLKPITVTSYDIQFAKLQII